MTPVTKGVACILTIGAVLGAVSAGVTTTVWALDTRYITIASFDQAMKEKDIRELQRDIRRLQFKVESGTATPAEKWELKDLEDELELLQQ